MKTSVHLVGSIGLDSVNDVFITVGQVLGTAAKRIPDGEPGGRRSWISWQFPLLRTSPYLQTADSDGMRASSAGFPKLRLRDGVSASELRFGELGYAREARPSYEDFLRARERGEVAPSTKFQVCLPTPFAVVAAFCAPDAVLDIEAAYEKAMLREVDTICATIPHKDLCLQWDVCVEMVMWDGQIKYHMFHADEAAILARLQRICRNIPASVELGFHLCYGDWEAKHFVEPIDAARMVSLANALSGTVEHPLAYIHMPVPIERDDDAFFAPFKNLHLKPGTELFLGLVHTDGVEGTLRRAKVAQKYVADFGVAAECGLGRCKTPNDVQSLLKIHADAARHLHN